jgi:hypothetical protein
MFRANNAISKSNNAYRLLLIQIFWFRHLIVNFKRLSLYEFIYNNNNNNVNMYSSDLSYEDLIHFVPLK